MIGEATWPRKTQNYLRKIHWQSVQSVPGQFCPKTRVWFKISLFLILWVKLFSMALHMSTRVYIQKISSLFEPGVLQLITGIGNQTVWEKSTLDARKVNSWHFESGISKSMPRGSYMWNLIKVGSWIHHLIRNWKSYLIWKWLTFHLGQVFMIVAPTLSPFSIKIKAPFENFSNMNVVPLVPSFL